MRDNRHRLTRRTIIQGSAGMGAGLAAARLTTGMPSAMASTQAEEGTRGGTLRVALVGEPPTLDEHQTTAVIVADITYAMYETLFTYDVDYQPIPLLVDTYTPSDDGLTHTMTLREGITFHNGEPMTAADVHASVMRWSQISGVGQNLFEAVDAFVEVDEKTVEFRLSTPFGPLLIALANNVQGCTIHPKSVIDAIGIDPFSSDDQLIGTGPYMLSERQADAYIRMIRFEDYLPREESTNGYGGARHAWVDEIEFVPVPNEASRVAGLQAGDYELAHDISNDQYEVLSTTPGIVAEINPPAKFECFFLNWRSPIMGNLAIREAFRAALNHEEILTASQGSSDFFVLDPGWMMQQSAWHTTAGEELYNVNDPELAKQKLEEAGYDGTPIRFLTSQERPTYFNDSVIAQQQLEAAGFVVDLQAVDWATVFDRRSQEDQWEVFVTGHCFVPDPSQITMIGQMGTYPGWYDSDASLALADQLLREPDFDTAYGIWEELQHNIYTEIPAIKLGDVAIASYYSERVGGWVNQIEQGIPYWNLWLKS